MPDLSLAYLKYLRDVSRRLIIRGGFEKIAPGTSRNPDCLSLLISERDAVWFRRSREEEVKPDREVFVGFGLITGTIRRGATRTKKLAGPIFFAQTTIDVDSERVLLLDDTITLNYDLIQHLVEVTVPSEEIEQITVEHQQDLLRLLQLLDEVDSMARCFSIPPEIGRSSTAYDLQAVSSLGKKLLTGLSELNPQLRIENVDCLNRESDAKLRIESKQLTCSPDGFLFAGKFPDQLSTYMALQRLADQLEDGSVENQLLERVLRGALENTPFDVEDSAIERDQIRQAIKFLPLTLSRSQKNAVYNAWENSISYVQGPPGTGKSHTIAAIMITALFMGKRVLLISQKKAAIDVVIKRLKLLAAGSDPTIFVSRTSSVKASLRNRIQGVLDDASGDHNEAKLREERRKNEKLRADVHSQRARLLASLNRLKRMLELQRKYFEANGEYIKRRDNLVATFQLEEGTTFAVLPVNEELSWTRRLEQTATIRYTSVRTRRDVLHLKATRKLAVTRLGANATLLNIQSAAFEQYLEALVRCCAAYNAVSRSPTAEADDVNVVRHNFLRELDVLIDLQKRLIASTQKLKCREQLTTPAQRENFARFKAMLSNVDPNLIEDKMSKLDYQHLTEAFPLWAGLIRDLGQYLRFDAELFDLVLVDESSQVNIAEAFPAFYRGRRICVVGDKNQLGLNAAGLFTLNRQLEQTLWNRHFTKDYSLAAADQKGLVVCKHSILEFVTSPGSESPVPEATLDEHFRSSPKLAEYTSKTFYIDEGGLRIMTLVGDRVTRPCFEVIRVDGQREEKTRIVMAEVDRAMHVLNDLIVGESWRTHPTFQGRFEDGRVPSIGVLSFTTDQNAEIRERLDGFRDEDRLRYDLFAGTTEEFQGNERNIMLLLPAADKQLTSAGFYNDKRRVNVATSRAIDFVYLIHGGLPPNFQMLGSYLDHFAAAEPGSSTPLDLIGKYFNWKLDKTRFASEFERRVCEFLELYITEHHKERNLKLFNQVQTCGKFLDFVVFNPDTSRAFAIEVDGQDHYNEDSLELTDAHIEREAILRRAGWKILHIPYYKWYYHGWLADINAPTFSHYAEKLRGDLHKYVQETVV